ncbi:related to Inhibitor-sensitive equilibrative nucleoside transporter 1 [Sporisorium reilianum f. sp. reilianum]|uniref:Related to Inhibitor-sensitive equilibrative nucleoside transporter 1 n=1 Tax=Sporisorium reilianum f. sp. reilianum TaxID=72559 RepID=A0A2N8U791_9BASI|nr:related to Inhibitor-sensitive equilibrative nucleoside transporter 1 [Sporisorium reilianum f. sp. reilianum]
MRPLRGEEQGLLARSHDDAPASPLLSPAHEDGPAEPLIKTGVEGAPAWNHMSSQQRTLVYVTFGLLGMGVLLPFNSLITPAEYFRSSFARTPYANTFSSWITVSYNVISILVGIHATATGGFERSSPRRRITLSSTAIILSVFCFALSTRIGESTSRTGHHDDAPPSAAHSNTYFYFTLLLGGLLSSACAYLQNSVVSLSTAFGGGGTFMGSMLAGQGVVGVGISIFGFASAWSQQAVRDDPASAVDEAAQETSRSIAHAATLFFGMNTILMMVVLAAFLWLTNTPLYAQVMAKQIATIDKIQDEHDDNDDDDDLEDGVGSREHPMVQSWHSIRSISHPAYTSVLQKVPGFYRLSPATRESLLRIALVQSKVKWDCAAVAFVFVVTLSIFPALTSAVQSVYTGTSRSSSLDLTSPQLFVPFHFFLFNLSDLLGRTLPSVVPASLIRRARALVSLSLLRALFVPLFMACNVVSTSQRTGPIGAAAAEGWLARLVQSSDAPFFALMLLLGFSNGLVSTCIMISGPSRSKLVNSKGASEGPLAATLLSFWLCVGLAVGSGLSFLTVKA